MNLLLITSQQLDLFYVLTILHLIPTTSSSFLDKINFLNRTATSNTTIPETNRYPQDALQCYATLSTQNKKIVCPKYRTNYCVKEVSNATRKECELGTSNQYSNDVWDPKVAKCIYRKCSDSCSNKTIYYNDSAITGWSRGNYWKRDVFCCGSSVCNSCFGLKNGLFVWKFMLGLYFILDFVLFI